MQEIQSQLTVIGAGPAGICAALAAAKNGIDTVLISERPVLGGNSSSEFRVWTRGATGAGNLFAEEMGIWGDLKLVNLYRNPDANPIFWDEALLDAALAEKKLRLFLNTTVFRVDFQQDRVISVSGVQLGTEKELTFTSDYYIDSTGDGSVAVKAGMKYSVGTAEGTLGSSILYYTKKADHPVSFIAPEYAYSFDKIKQLRNHGGRIISEKMSGSDCWWFEYGGTMNTIQDEQEITIELKKLVMGVWNYIKNSGKFNADNYTLEWIGNIAGKRESRRIQTRTQLKASDIHANMNFLDAGFYGGWYIDSHPPGGINDSEEQNCIQRPVNAYPIPLRCLYGEVKNLIVAGRIIGTDNEAFFSSRVMNTCALSGQAAGTLAADCIQKNIALDELQGNDFVRVQKQLIKDDMFIPGTRIEDEEDVLLHTKAEASSNASGKPDAKTGQFALLGSVFAVFPAAKGKVSIALYSNTNTEVNAVLFASSLPNRYLTEGDTKNYRWQVHEGENIVSLEVPEEMAGRFVVIHFKPVQDVFLEYTGKRRPGFLCGLKESSAYEEPRIYYQGDEPFYTADKVTDGYNRIWNQPHAWMPAEKDPEPRLSVDLKGPAVLKEIRLYLDPDLSMELVNSRTEHWRADHKYTKRDAMPSQLIKDMEVCVQMADGSSKVIAAIKDNYHRMVILPVDEKESIVRIELVHMHTWGNSSPVIYEISAYMK
jgi:hypothetical protein